MITLTRFFRRIIHFYKLNMVMTVGHIPLLLLTIAAVNTFAFMFAYGTPALALLPALNFMLLFLWIPQLYAAVINAIWFSDGLTELPLQAGQNVHVTFQSRTTKVVEPGDPSRMIVRIDSPPADIWGKDSEAELLLVLESTAKIRPRSQTLYLHKDEPSATTYFELVAPDGQMQRWLLSVYLVAPVRQVTLLKQLTGTVTARRTLKAKEQVND